MRSQSCLLVAFADDDLDNRGGEEAERCEQGVDETGLPRWEVHYFLRNVNWVPRDRGVRAG